jgi:hypothetical protein
MQHQSLALLRLFMVLQASLFMLSPRLLWAQRPPPQKHISVRSSARAAQPAPVSEAKSPLPRSFEAVPLSLEKSHGKVDPKVTFATCCTSYYRIPMSTPSTQLPFTPSVDTSRERTTPHADDLEYYGHHIPWAGRFILRIDQESKAHPRVTSIIKMLRPRI